MSKTCFQAPLVTKQVNVGLVTSPTKGASSNEEPATKGDIDNLELKMMDKFKRLEKTLFDIAEKFHVPIPDPETVARPNYEDDERKSSDASSEDLSSANMEEDAEAK